MHNPDGPLQFRLLTESDIAAALALSTQAGWNQVAADWSRLVSLWPGACFGGFADGLVATGTLATFAISTASSAGWPATAGNAGWIGMILVDMRCRGRGLGTAMMGRLLETARDAGLACVGLDATDMGRPVYEKLGFQPHSVVHRWVGRGGPTPSLSASAPAVRPLAAGDWPAVAALDRRGVGVIRLPLLQQLASEPGGTGVAAFDAGRLVAFGLARAGRTAAAIGPLVAETPAAATAVFSVLAAQADGVDVLVDVPEGAAVEAALADAGFAVSRRLTRMLLPLAGPPVALLSPLVQAGAGFELG